MNLLHVALSLELDIRSSSSTRKVTLSIRRVTRQSFKVCASDVEYESQPGRSVLVNWLTLYRNDSHIQSGIAQLSRKLVFLDGHCEMVSDQRASNIRGDATILPGFSEGWPSTDSMQTSSSGLVRWVERLNSGKFLYCLQRVLGRSHATDSLPTLETYFLVDGGHSNGYLETGQIPIPPWRTGHTCRYVKLERPHQTRPHLFSVILHPAAHGNAYSSDSAVTWFDDVTAEGFSLCFEEVRWFWEDNQGFRSEAVVHWVAVHHPRSISV